MDENLINFFHNSGDGFLMEEYMSDESECNEITSATHKVGVVKLPSTRKTRTRNQDDADEESDDTEYPSCSKERKRRIVWSKNAETFLLELWEKYFVALRSVRKNAHIYTKIADQLKQKSGHKFSGHEVKIKIQNVQSKYIDERKRIGLSGGTPSTWVHYSKVHSIVGDYKSFDDVVPQVKEITGDEQQDINAHSSDHEYTPTSIRSEVRKKRKIANQQEERICVTDIDNSIAKEELELKENDISNSENHTALLEEEFLIDEFLSDESESSEPIESADEKSNDREYPSCSKDRKRRIVWSKYAERLLLELWEKNVVELRSERKNAHVYREIAEQLTTNGHKLSGYEVKTKIQNLHTKYNEEKKKLESCDSTPSTWTYYSKIHTILGRQNSTPLVKKSDYHKFNPHNSHHEVPSASNRAESRNKKKVTDQQEELICALNTANSIAEKELVLKEKDILNSKKQTALIEQQIEILQGIAASTEQFQANILKLFKKK